MSSSKKTNAGKSHTPAKSEQPKKTLKPPITLATAGLFLLLIGLSAGISFAVAQKFGGHDTKSTAKAETPIHYVDLTATNTDPIDLLIKKDEYVQFNSKDGNKHQIVQTGLTHTAEHSSASNSLADSGVFKNDEGYLLQFKDIGKFEFQDKPNSTYTITVIVYDPTKSVDDVKLKP